jgi:hypothetical protein
LQKVRPKWNQKKAAIKQKQRHDIRFGVTGFKTRTTGTKKQIGKKFPVEGSKLPLPQRLQMKFSRSRSPLLNLAAKEIVGKNLEGETVAVKLRNGRTLITPLAGGKLQTIDPSEVREIAILSGGKFDLQTTLHKFGSAARTAAEFAQKAPERLEHVTTKLGQIAAYPERLSNAYDAGRHPGQHEIETLKKQIAVLQAKHRIDMLKQPESPESVRCPHCGSPVPTKKGCKTLSFQTKNGPVNLVAGDKSFTENVHDVLDLGRRLTGGKSTYEYPSLDSYSDEKKKKLRDFLDTYEQQKQKSG